MTWTLNTEPSANGNQYSAGGVATSITPPSPTVFPVPPAGFWRELLETGNNGNISPVILPSVGGFSYNGDVIISQAGKGIIVLSPTGRTAWRILINDDGAVARQSVSISQLIAMGLWTVEMELAGIGNLWSNQTTNGPLYGVLNGDLKLTFGGTGIILLTPSGFGPYRLLVADDGAVAVQGQAIPRGPQTTIPPVVVPTGAWGLLAELENQGNDWSLDQGGFLPPVSPAIFNQDFVIGVAGAGVVCQTPTSGHSYRIGVDDSGAIFSQKVS